MRRANLPMEQRQLVMSQLQKDISPSKVEEVIYYLFGQDYKGKFHDGAIRTRPGPPRGRMTTPATRWARQWRSVSAYAANNEPDYEDAADAVENDEAYVEEGDYEEPYDDAEDTFFGMDAYADEPAYYEDEDEEIDEAIVAYLTPGADLQN